jgi:hypothetical protein
LTVKGTGGLSNTGNINVQGNGGATAKLVVANMAANSGTITIGGSGDLTAAAQLGLRHDQHRQLRRSDRG